MKRFILVVALASMIALSAVVSPAQAQTSPLNKWRRCDNTKAGLLVKSTFSVSTSVYGKGRFYIKTQIRWDQGKAGMWRVRDSPTSESRVFQSSKKNTLRTFKTGDRTTWGNIYYKTWRAHVIVKLMKVRRGPDKKVLKEHRYYSKAVFPEKSECIDFRLAHRDDR